MKRDLLALGASFLLTGVATLLGVMFNANAAGMLGGVALFYAIRANLPANPAKAKAEGN